MKQASVRITSVVASFALAVAMVPAPAFAHAVSEAADGESAVPFTQASTQQAADSASAAQGGAGAGGAFVEGEILVTFSGEGSALSRLMTIASVPEADELSTLQALDLAELGGATGEPVVVKLDEGCDEEQAVRDAQALPNVASAQLNYLYYLDDVLVPASTLSAQVDEPLTNDPALASYDATADKNAWHLREIDIESAWSQVKCEGSVTVAVFDTGCDMEHEDLADNVLSDYAWNAYKGEPLSCDYYGHGTHVAGCIAATASNGKGTAGSSYNAKILPVNVFDAYGSDQWSSTTKALVSAYDYIFEFDDRHPEYNLHVVNMSLGGYDSSTADDVALQNRIKTAKERDIVSVCAGGNGINGVSQTDGHYPSDYADCVGVTALSKDGYTPTTWCDRNSNKDICTPGEDIYSTVPLYCKMEGNANWWGYSAVSGTSMATPITAGVFALLWAARPDLTVDSAIEAVKATASDRLQFPDDSWYSDHLVTDYGAGILSAGNAVAYAKSLAPSESMIESVSDAARDSLDALELVRVSADGSDVPTTLSWVTKATRDNLSSAAVAARDAAAANASYAELAAARDNLNAARATFDLAVAPGTMKLASNSAKSALRHLARNAKADMQGIVASADGKGVATGGKWVAASLSNRLSAAIDAANALVGDEFASDAAVTAASKELTSARSAYNAGVKTVAASEKIKKDVVINTATVNAKTVKNALRKANNTGATTITLGAKVKKISAKAFVSTKAKTLVVKTKNLTAKSVKGSLTGSSVKAVTVKVGKAKANKTYASKYEKLFVKNVAGKKAKVKAA